MNEMNPENDTSDVVPPPLPPRRMMKPRPWLVRLVAEHNPFYLLSAACMLASCLALTNTVTWNPIATRRLLTLIVTPVAYSIFDDMGAWASRRKRATAEPVSV